MSRSSVLGETCTPITGPGDLPGIRVANAVAEAELFANGGHVTRFQPRDQDRPVLWLSERSRWRAGQPIRGGIPVCWPWFADFGPAQAPAHGVARTATWRWVDSAELADGATRLTLALTDDRTTRRWWPHAFALQLVVTVGRSLDVCLRMRNPGPEALRWTGALHSYFAVGDVRSVAITGFEGCRYRDRMADDAMRVQHGPIRFRGETDRIYFGGAATARIHDPVWDRTVAISGRGSGSTVVWNPWTAKSARMADFGDHEWPGMCCVETARAPGDSGDLAPGASAELGVTIGIE